MAVDVKQDILSVDAKEPEQLRQAYEQKVGGQRHVLDFMEECAHGQGELRLKGKAAGAVAQKCLQQGSDAEHRGYGDYGVDDAVNLWMDMAEIPYGKDAYPGEKKDVEAADKDGDENAGQHAGAAEVIGMVGGSAQADADEEAGHRRQRQQAGLVGRELPFMGIAPGNGRAEQHGEVVPGSGLQQAQQVIEAAAARRLQPGLIGRNRNRNEYKGKGADDDNGNHQHEATANSLVILAVFAVCGNSV